MENTLFYIFLFLIYPVLMFGTVLYCTAKKEETKPEKTSDNLEMYAGDEDLIEIDEKEFFEDTDYLLSMSELDETK